MDDHDEPGNAFAIPQFRITPNETFLTAQTVFADFECQPLPLPLGIGQLKSDEATLPNLQLPNLLSLHLNNFSDESLEIFDTPGSSSASLSDVSIGLPELIDRDIWSAQDLLIPETSPDKPGRWESFHNKDFTPLSSPYISEGGSGAYDALLSFHSKSDNLVLRVLRQDLVIASLAQLGLGRDSLLYTYDVEDQTFRARTGAEHARPTGFSPATFASLEADVIAQGNCMKALRLFATNAYTSVKPIKAQVSLASAVRDILQEIGTTTYPGSQSVQSLLQLQALFHTPGIILRLLDDLVSHAGSATSDVQILSLMYEFAENLEHSTSGRSLIFEILLKTSESWLGAIDDWLFSGSAFRSSDSALSFIRMVEENEAEGHEQCSKIGPEFDSSAVPIFLAVEDARRIFEIGRSLRLLQTQTTRHPLARPADTNFVERIPLTLQSTWPDFDRVQERADQYQLALLSTIQQFDAQDPEFGVPTATLSSESPLPDITNQSEPSAETILSISTAEIERPLPISSMNGVGGHLSAVAAFSCIKDEGTEETLLSKPPLNLLPSLSFSFIISAQGRLVNQSCITLLFKEHGLRSHLSLQYRYSLLCDGVFVSRLSHALFDPNLPSTERRKGSPRLGVSGLKIGSRDAWPPASSELRLALMGILSDSYYRGESLDNINLRPKELPGGMSFAIRAMPEDELQKCMNPNSVFALDFLRIQYKPPPPVDAVITQSSLDKYDAIFKLLLRASRMLYCVKQLSLATVSRGNVGHQRGRIQLFPIEAHHFIGSVYSHFFEVINVHWNTFKHHLDHYEERAQRYEISEHEGLDKLRDLHEDMLDQIMFGLLLRKRQDIVKGLLEEIFELILECAEDIGAEKLPNTAEQDLSEKQVDLYNRWRRKVKVFTGVCRGLSERKGAMGSQSLDKGNNERSIERLLLKLEMNGYYSQRTI